MNTPATSTPKTKAHIQPGRCDGCAAEILFVQMGPRKDGTPGGTMPVDPPWQYGDGRKNLVILDDQGRGKLVVKAPPEVLGREPHWGRCPKRNRFKRRK